MKHAVIELKNIGFAYDNETPLLSQINVSIDENDFIAIIGPNGSGKTTLLKLLLGFLKPTEGSVRIFGKTPVEMHSLMGYVPQVNLYDQKFPISVLDVVMMGASSTIRWYGSYPKNVKESAINALDLVGLSHLKGRTFGTLSGGQAQRVLIARAIINHPKILFLDEPTANIDTDTQKEILQLLHRLKKKMTIVMVTHHLQSFIKEITRVFCIQNTLTEFRPDQICEHFSFGVFHSPLLQPKPNRSL